MTRDVIFWGLSCQWPDKTQVNIMSEIQYEIKIVVSHSSVIATIILRKKGIDRKNHKGREDWKLSFRKYRSVELANWTNCNQKIRRTAVGWTVPLLSLHSSTLDVSVFWGDQSSYSEAARLSYCSMNNGVLIGGELYVVWYRGRTERRQGRANQWTLSALLPGFPKG